MSVQSDVVIKTYFETGDIPTEVQFVNFIDSKKHINDGLVVSLGVGVSTITVFAGRRLNWIGLNANGAQTIKIGTAGAGSDDLLPQRSMADNEDLSLAVNVWARAANKTLYITATDVDIYLLDNHTTPIL